MPENDKIQLPKGFKLDQGAGQPEVKLPKGFTLETADVKKKNKKRFYLQILWLRNLNWHYQILKKVKHLLKKVF